MQAKMRCYTDGVATSMARANCSDGAIIRNPEEIETSCQTALIAGLFVSIRTDALRRFCFTSGLPHGRDNASVIREVISHSRRTGLYVQRLALAIMPGTLSNSHLNGMADQAATLGAAALFHDVGKLAVPARILGKAGRLDTTEFEMIKRHPVVGAQMIGRAAKGFPSHFVQFAREMAAFHHERWNGTGYPFRLKGTQVPLAARLMAIADVYDAIVHDRVYKSRHSHDEAVATIRGGSGEAFDPALVDAFLLVSPDLKVMSEDMVTARGRVNQ